MAKVNTNVFHDYQSRLQATLANFDWEPVYQLASELLACWRGDRQFFICGNGGSAGNAIHLANDYLYGVAKADGRGLRVTALPANSAIMTCLANDVSYDKVFSQQLAVLARPGDLLLVLSGSGSSPNVVDALLRGKEIGMKSAAILGFTGGRCKELADVPIHFAVDDMQIAEDLQLIVGHMLMQWLVQHKDN